MAIRIAVIFGGRSGEHEVSLVSAESVLKNLDPSRYEAHPVGITKQGKWLYGPGVLDALKSGKLSDNLAECVLSLDPAKKCLYVLNRAGSVTEVPIEVVFPVLHGTFGEDGCIQGVFEVADLPYVGSGVLGSALGMDKAFQKLVFSKSEIPHTEYRCYYRREYERSPGGTISTIELLLDYPVFVKPTRLGSSVGISKAGNTEQLVAAIELAFQFDEKCIVEHAVAEPHEIEVAVLGNEDPIASVPGEIKPSNEFYDYNAKYVDDASKIIIPADLPGGITEYIRALAIRAFHSIHCEGLARVDFLLSGATGDIYVNEVNTMPGFTSISMYPKLFEAGGMPYPKLLDRLIELAFERYARQSGLQRSYTPVTTWYAGPSNG